jgi:hypothetical protein
MTRTKPAAENDLFARCRSSGLIECGTRVGVELVSVEDLRGWLVQLHAAVAYADKDAPPLRTVVSLRLIASDESVSGKWPTPSVIVRGRGPVSYRQACDLMDQVEAVIARCLAWVPPPVVGVFGRTNSLSHPGRSR